MKRISAFFYGIACYGMFFATLLYAIGFIGNFGVPKSIDASPEGSTGTALAIDGALLALFALQHSIMARPWFKRAWTHGLRGEFQYFRRLFNAQIPEIA
jgi:hypothetical protein